MPNQIKAELLELLDEAKDIFLYLQHQKDKVEKENTSWLSLDEPEIIEEYYPSEFAKQAFVWLKKYLKINNLKETTYGKRLNNENN